MTYFSKSDAAALRRATARSIAEPVVKVSGAGEHIASAPPAGMHPITNLFWDPAAQKVVIEYDDLGGASGTLISTPPQGMYAITNLYFNPAIGKLIGEYEDTI